MVTQSGPRWQFGSARRTFIGLESAAGILLMIAGAAAMLVANSPLGASAARLWDMPVAVQVGALSLHKPLLLWVNDGLMAVFFLLVGLEIKREILEGELSDPRKLALPGIGAIGGMAVPALIHVIANRGDAVALRGWAIPSATDIAFALGVLSLVGSRVPAGLKLFLLALAILDDLGAIVVIALFYTSDLSTSALALAGAGVLALFALNRFGVRSVGAYLVVGVFLWICVLKSGVHATLAGVVTALAIPLRGPEDEHELPPLRRLEHVLHPWVAFGILPVFALANAGVPLTGVSWRTLLEPVTVGIGLGLFIGKQVGVFGASWLAVASGLARLPVGVTWRHLYGASILCGIGFTMSLFIASLAYEGHGAQIAGADRLGIMLGTLLSSVVGLLFLATVLPPALPFGELRNDDRDDG